MQSLYELEFRQRAGDPSADVDKIIAKNIIPYEKPLGDVEFVYELMRGVVGQIPHLDEELKPMAPEWPIESIPAIDRNILRMGLYELEFTHDQVPPKVAINEAVELAKAFGAENTSKFINGVLGTAFRQLGLVDEGKDAKGGKKENETDDKNHESETKPAKARGGTK